MCASWRPFTASELSAPHGETDPAYQGKSFPSDRQTPAATCDVASRHPVIASSSHLARAVETANIQPPTNTQQAGPLQGLAAIEKLTRGRIRAVVKSDIEVAREAKMRPIAEVAAKVGIPADALLQYGPTKAKVTAEFIDSLKSKPDGKLILVTAINPTPAGEGKTTTTVGLGDGLNRIGKKAIMALRQAAAMPRSCRWRTSIFISLATSTPSPAHTTCCRR
jgi:hypothetical protein